MVRSKLEYADVIWSPFYNIHVQTIERVQRKFLSYLYYTEHRVYPDSNILSYNELSNVYSVNLLEKRRLVHQLSFIYKLIHGTIDNPDLLSQLSFHVPRIASRYSQTFSYDVPLTNQHLNSPLLTMSALYDNLSEDVDIFFCSFQQLCSAVYLL